MRKEATNFVDSRKGGYMGGFKGRKGKGEMYLHYNLKIKYPVSCSIHCNNRPDKNNLGRKCILLQIFRPFFQPITGAGRYTAGRFPSWMQGRRKGTLEFTGSSFYLHPMWANPYIPIPHHQYLPTPPRDGATHVQEWLPPPTQFKLWKYTHPHRQFSFTNLLDVSSLNQVNSKA